MMRRTRQRAPGGGSGNFPFSVTQLLLHMDGADASATFTDNSQNAFAITVSGNTQIDTAQSVFGGASGLFDGSADFLQVPNNAALEFFGSDWTAEFRMRAAALAADQMLISRRDSGGTGNGWQIGVTTGGVVFLQGSGSSLSSPAAAVTAGNWHAIGITHQTASNTARIYVDGVRVASGTVSLGATLSQVMLIGRREVAAFLDFGGHIDELRLSNVCRYTDASYALDVAAFPDS